MSENPSVTVEETSDGDKTLRLVGEVSVFQATELHRLAMLLAQQIGDVCLECGELRSIDLAAGQILLALQRVMSSQGRHLSIQSASKELADLFTFADLKQIAASSVGNKAVLNGEDGPISQSPVPQG
jgi:ABC-type transporter Mla MlaB component